MDYLLSFAAIQALLSLSVFVVMVTGQVSFGQQGFYAIGAYAAGIATVVWGWHIVPALLFGMVASGVAGMLVGIPVLRVRGLYLGVATLAFGEIMRNLLEHFRYVRTQGAVSVGPQGLEGFRGMRYFYDRGIGEAQVLAILIAALVLVVVVLWRLDRSRLGRVFRAIGEDEHAAAMAGVRVVAMKVLAFAIGGAVAGLAGGLYAHYTTFVEAGTFNVSVGVIAVAMVLVGGTATVFGPVLGVVFFTLVAESFRSLGGFRQVAYGALIVLAMLVRPFGLLDTNTLRRFAGWMRPKPPSAGPPADLQEAFDRAPH